jgi:hypothetical protein
MSHPTVLLCALRVAEANRVLVEIDRRAAASEPELMNLLGTSRAAIERSRDLLRTLK